MAIFDDGLSGMSPPSDPAVTPMTTDPVVISLGEYGISEYGYTPQQLAEGAGTNKKNNQ
jgi:hypothetical protein